MNITISSVYVYITMSSVYVYEYHDKQCLCV